MTFEVFATNFKRDEGLAGAQGNAPSNEGRRGIQELFRRFGGASFQNGLYRIVHPTDIEVWHARVSLGFPQFEKRITCFGFDWLGTVFAIDSDRLVEGQPGVLMFEPGTGKALQIPQNVESFHATGLQEFGEAILAISFYEKWLVGGGVVPNQSQCVGYKQPLFLGGRDTIENLEVSDLDVYWHLAGQMIRKVREVAEGTRVKPTAG